MCSSFTSRRRWNRGPLGGTGWIDVLDERNAVYHKTPGGGQATVKVWLRREVSGRRGEGRRGLLERHATARQVLQKLAGKITFTPTRGKMGAPAYDITAPLTFERVFSGILVHMGNVPSGP